MKKFIILFIILFISQFIGAQNGFKLSGKLSGFEENSLVRITKDNIVIDSCLLKNGYFQLKGKFIDEPNTVYLQIFNKDDFKYTSLFIGNEKITIDADIQDFKYDVKTKGSRYYGLRLKYSQLNKELYVQRGIYENEVSSIREQNRWTDSLQTDYWGREKHLGKIILIDKKLEENNRKFIDENINSYYALDLLSISKFILPKDYILKSVEKINSKFKETIAANSIMSFLQYPDLKIGDGFHDFNAFDKNGQEIKFSKYFNQKYVLLDFSTLYCGFCIEAIPVLDKLKKKKREQLEIITFYVDKDSKGFENFNKKHSEDWITIWDKKGRLSETYSMYKIEGTPTLYLFGFDGKLIKKFDGFEKDLVEQIEKLIAK